jgi:hypothetical protein
MKKLILAFLTVGAIATANAQEPKSLLLYGDLGYNTVSDSLLNKHYIWDVTIGLGYQFSPHWTVGGNISWAQNIYKDGATFVETVDNTYKIGPFARYSHYLCNSEIFFWYAHWDFLYQGGYTTSGGDAATNKHTGIYTGIYPALGINVCRGLCLNFSIGGIGYSTDKFSNANYSSDGFNFTFGHQMNVGISKNFNTGHRMHSSHEPGEEIQRRRMEKMEDEDDEAPKPKRKERNRDEDE